MSVPDDPNEGKKGNTKPPGFCQVCGDSASINNYGALSCFCCRTFFRRNASAKKDGLICRYDGNCEVNMLTRKTCTACRLAKCFLVGMSADLIRREDLANAKKKVKIGQLTTMMSVLPPTIDGVGTQLTAADHTLVSNIIHAFDTFSPVTEVRGIIATLNTSAPDFQYDVSQSLGITFVFYHSLQLIIGSTPDFQVLTSAEQCSLFQRNMLGLLSFGGLYLMRECGIFEKPENEMILLPLYGHEVIQQVKAICEQLDGDSVLLKQMLVALAFSSNCYTLHNLGNLNRDSLLLGTFRLFGSQNVYVELMWKYLIHTYDHQMAVRYFSKLIKLYLNTLRFSIDLYENNPIHRAFVDSTMEHMEQSSVIQDGFMVPLWGKQPRLI